MEHPAEPPHTAPPSVPIPNYEGLHMCGNIFVAVGILSVVAGMFLSGTLIAAASEPTRLPPPPGMAPPGNAALVAGAFVFLEGIVVGALFIGLAYLLYAIRDIAINSHHIRNSLARA